MRCTRIEELLPLYVEHDLSEEEMRRVRAHLSACESCRESEAGFRMSQARIHAYGPPAFSEDFYEEMRLRVLAQINSTDFSQPSFLQTLLRGFPRPLALAASLLLLVGFGMAAGIIYQRLSKSAPQSVARVNTILEIKQNPFTTAREDSGNRPVLIKEQEQRAVDKAQSITARRDARSTRSVRPRSFNQSQDARDVQLEPKGNEVASSTLAQDRSSGASTSAAASNRAVARMEIQTSDPSIRIIWLTPKAGE